MSDWREMTLKLRLGSNNWAEAEMGQKMAELLTSERYRAFVAELYQQNFWVTGIELLQERRQP